MDTLSQIGLYALPVIGSIMLMYGLFHLVADLRKVDQKRVLDRLTERGGPDKRKDTAESIVRRRTEPQTVMAAMLGKFSFIPGLQRALDQANLQWSPTTTLVNLLALSLFSFIALYFVEASIWLLASIPPCVLILPLMAIHIKRKMRLHRMMNQLPDVFELMSQALRAGHSLANSIHLIGQQMPDPAGTEFAIVFYEQNLGVKIEDALKDMADRLDLMDVRFFVTAVLIQRTTGGDLAEVLDNISGVIRERIKLYGQVKALTAEGRLSGWVLFALPFVVFGMEQVVNPQYGRILLEERLGQYALVAALVMQLIGLAMIKKIVNIKV